MACSKHRARAERAARACRWDECWIRLLDGMLQLSFSDSGDCQLRRPVRVRSITIRQPAGGPACELLVHMDRLLGSTETELASIAGMEVVVAPRRAGSSAYTCAVHRAKSLGSPIPMCLHARRP